MSTNTMPQGVGDAKRRTEFVASSERYGEC